MLNKSAEALKSILWVNIGKPIQENLTLTLLIAGVVSIILGAVHGDWIDSLPFVPDGSGEALLKTGSALLGAGVFAVIVKSAQFVEIFQSHIHDVFYRPIETFGVDDLKRKWILLTDKILESTLPASHRTASQRIERQYFNEELAYHFEGYETKYDVVVGKDGRTAEVLHTIRTKLVVSPQQDDPVFTQDLVVTGDCRLTSLVVDGKPVGIDGILKQDADRPERHEFVLPLKEYARPTGSLGDRIIDVERTYEITQDLLAEPHFMATIIRYAKGLTIKAKIRSASQPGYRFYFAETGIGAELELPGRQPYVDGEGYQCWVLAEPDHVLLPGQGFVLIVLPQSETSSTATG